MNKRLRYARRLAAWTIGSLIVGVILAACDQGSVGIFATIEAEERIRTNNLVDNASIRGLVLTNVSGTDTYVALANTKAFRRNQSGDDWSEIGNPGALLGLFLVGVNTDGATTEADEHVYGVFADVNGSIYRVYELEADLTWSAAPVFEESGYAIEGMVGYDVPATGASGVLLSRYLLAGTREREFLSWSGQVTATPGATHAKAGSVSTLGDDIRDIVVTDSETTDIVVIVGRQGGSFSLPTASLGTADTAYDLFNAHAGGAMRGVGIRTGSGAGDDLIALVRADDSIIVSDDVGATWQTIDTGTGRSYTDILWVPQIGDSGAFVVGTESRELENTTRRGYYHAFLGGTSGDYSFSVSNDLGDNYDGSDLAISAINSFALFDTNQLFALTNGLGLWSTRYTTGSTVPSWTWE